MFLFFQLKIFECALHSAIFEEAKTRLEGCIAHWGFQQSREEYFSILRDADVAVSTALHEFFGVSM